MQSKQIIVGDEYAVRQHKWSKHERAKVLDTDATERVMSPYDRRVVSHRNTGMIKVEFLSRGRKGEVAYLKPKQIVQTWKAELADRREARAAAKAQAAHDAQVRLAGARRAFALHEALAAKGKAVGVGYNYDDEDYAALVDAGFKPIPFTVSRVESTVYALDAAMMGHLDTRDLDLLLGLAEPGEPDEYLDEADDEDDIEID